MRIKCASILSRTHIPNRNKRGDITTDLRYKDVVLHAFPGFHDAYNRSLNLMFSVLIHLIPSFFSFWL